MKILEINSFERMIDWTIMFSESKMTRLNISMEYIWFNCDNQKTAIIMYKIYLMIQIK